MKKLRNLLRKKPAPTVTGITMEEYHRIVNALNVEYQKSTMRQHADTRKPSRYMEGLMFAIKVMDRFPPHDMEVTQ